mgnify:CR=1 FL=1
MRGDDKITNQNKVVVSFPAEDKKISQVLIISPALKTIKNEPMIPFTHNELCNIESN